MKKIWTPEYCIKVRVEDNDKELFQDIFLKYLYRYMFRDVDEKPWGKIETCYEICKMVGEGNMKAWQFWMRLNKFQKDRFCTAAEMWQTRALEKGTPVRTVVWDGKVLVD